MNTSQEFYLCDNCQTNIYKKYIYFTGDYILCEQCYNKKYSTCDFCGEKYENKFIKNITVDDKNTKKHICHLCSEFHFCYCYNCGKTINKVNKYYINNNNNRAYCPECYHKLYEKCKFCGSIERKKDLYTFDGYEYFCYKCGLKHYKKCNSCDKFINPIKIEDPKLFNYPENSKICPDCYISQNYVHAYSFKPNPHFYKLKDEHEENIYLGCEVEIECDKSLSICVSELNNLKINHKQYISLFIDHNLHNIFYQKRDASIQYGIEMVSHPLTFEAWNDINHKIVQTFSFMSENHCKSLLAKNCGMHVHMTKKFMTDLHKKLLSYFIYSNRKYIEKIAGRESNTYTKYIDIDKRYLDDLYSINSDRHNAINWNNKETVEIRIFQSVLDPFLFYKNLEFCHAAYMFTKNLNISDVIYNKKCLKNFYNFIKNDEKYQKLTFFIDDNKILSDLK